MVCIFESSCGLDWSYGCFQVVVKMGAAFVLMLLELLLDLGGNVLEREHLHS